MAQGDSRPPSPPLAAGEPLVGVWPALLVGLVCAILAWLWYGRGGEEPPEPRGGGSSSSKAPSPDHCGAAPGATEPPLENREHALLETSVLSSPQEPVESLAGTPKEDHIPSRDDGVPGESPETESLVKDPATPLMNYCEYLLSESFSFPNTEPELVKGQESEAQCGATLAAASPSRDEDKNEEQPVQMPEYQDLAGHDEWEVVPEHSPWGDAGKNSSADDSDASVDHGNKGLEQVDSLELDSKAKRVAAVPPMPQNIHVNFRVHYITHTDAQLIAVTGDHECLGEWHNYVPLQCDKDGFWSDTVILPADTRIEWKFILVENGKVTRWEECNNRILMTEHEDRMAHQWWGYH